jgi:hypothetical protein
MKAWVMAALLLAAHQAPWREFHADTLGISFRHPATPGLRFEARAATCAASDAEWQGGLPDSMVVVTRTVARWPQIASLLGLVRESGQWVAAGYEGRRAPVAAVHVAGWDALVVSGATTVVYDLALRSPVAAPQWRLAALGPATDGCRPLVVALATGLAAPWDSTTVAGILRSMRLRTR